MLLDRHRIAKLIELADLEGRVTGPERMLREEDVALLVKAAYDDASETARAEFMARVQPMPTTAWPWSAVQAKVLRGAGAGGAGGRGVVGVFVPKPGAITPAALILIRGEAESADVEPGNRLPDRGTPEAAQWEPLFKAIDAWDTAAITRWIGPQGWVSSSGATAGQTQGTGGGAVNERPATPPEPSLAPMFSWRSPTVIAVGTTVASTVGVILFSLRGRRPLADMTRQQEKP